MPGSNLANVGQSAKGVGKRVLCDLTLTVVAFDALRLAQTAGHIFVAASLLSATRVACLHVRGEAIRRAWPSVNTMSSRYLASNEIALFLARSFALSAVVFCRIHIHSSDVSSRGCVTARRITRPGVIVYSGWEQHSRDSSLGPLSSGVLSPQWRGDHAGPPQKGLNCRGHYDVSGVPYFAILHVARWTCGRCIGGGRTPIPEYS